MSNSAATSQTLDVKLSFATANDLNAICAVENDCFSTPWSATSIQNELTELSWSRTVIATVGEQTIGYVSFWTIAEEFQILKVAVSPRFQKRGIAGKLIQHIINLGIAEKIELITLELRHSNTAAKRLYQKHHFEIAGVRSGYYSDTREDAILMNFEL